VFFIFHLVAPPPPPPPPVVDVPITEVVNTLVPWLR
jgi:hypothetical protein